MKNDSRNPFPSGWFAVAFSYELKKGQVISKTFMGQEIVLFRTEAGVSSALDAHCPHLGAHLGHGGTVEGDCLRCPFHHFEFYADGSCNKSKHLKANKWPLVERDGFIFLYYGNPDKKHELLHLTADGWETYKTFAIKLKTQVQNPVENFVDINHFGPIHHVDSITLHNLSSDGETFSIEYTSRQRIFLFDRNWGPSLLSELSLCSFGLGYSLIKTYIYFLDLEVALLYSPAPIDDQYVEARIQLFTKPNKSKSLLFKFIKPFFMHIYFITTCHFFKHDEPIWANQKYLPRPFLINDTPIYRFRRWAKRFYDVESN